MKKLLISLLFILLPLPAFAQIDIRQSTATQVEILGVIVTGGFFTTTGSGATANMSVSLVKAADSALPIYSSWSPTVRGGGTHDCDITSAGKNTWTCELTAGDTDTQGRTIICMDISTQNVHWCQPYIVSAQTSYDANHGGNLADYTVLTNINTKVNTNLDATVSSRGSYSIKANTAVEWPMKFRNPTTGADISGSTPSCTRSIDSPNSFSATANTASTTTSTGWSEITLAASDLNATYYSILRCTAGAGTYETIFKVQAP